MRADCTLHQIQLHWLRQLLAEVHDGELRTHCLTYGTNSDGVHASVRQLETPRQLRPGKYGVPMLELRLHLGKRPVQSVNFRHDPYSARVGGAAVGTP